MPRADSSLLRPLALPATDKLNSLRCLLLKRPLEFPEARKHFTRLCRRGAIFIRKTAKIWLPKPPQSAFLASAQKTLFPGVKPLYYCTWGFKCNILNAAYSPQPTGLNCLSVGRDLGRQGPGSATPLEISRVRSAVWSLVGSFLGSPAYPSMGALFRATDDLFRMDR